MSVVLIGGQECVPGRVFKNGLKVSSAGTFDLVCRRVALKESGERSVIISCEAALQVW